MENPKKAESFTISLPSGSPMQIIVILLLVGGAFFLGSLWQKVNYLEGKGGAANIAAGTGGGAGAAAPGVPAAQPPAPTAGPLPKLTKDDHVRGSANAKLAIVEYSDLECPFCKQFHPTMKQVLDTYKGDVQWVYRHYPLSFHANAQKESEASECAWDQGGNDAFWKYVDAIYERTTANGTGFALDKLAPLAAELGLNEGKFKECLDTGKFTKKVTDEMAGGTTAGVTGTPGSIVLNIKTGETQMIPGAVPFDQVKTIIDGMLKK